MGMKTTFNTVPETVRTAALAAARKQPRVNPYLFDVRKDKELRNLLRDAADHGDTVNLPVGAYMISFTDAVDNLYPAENTWVLVNAKGKTRYCYNGLPREDTTKWVKWVQRYLGILPKTTKKTKTKKETKKTKPKKKRNNGIVGVINTNALDGFGRTRDWQGHDPKDGLVMHHGYGIR